MITEYLANKWFKIGFWLAVIGWGPLLLIILFSTLGLWPDPDPNPVGPGLLFFLSFWPAVISMVVGIRQVRRG